MSSRIDFTALGNSMLNPNNVTKNVVKEGVLGIIGREVTYKVKYDNKELEIPEKTAIIALKLQNTDKSIKTTSDAKKFLSSIPERRPEEELKGPDEEDSFSESGVEEDFMKPDQEPEKESHTRSRNSSWVSTQYSEDEKTKGIAKDRFPPRNSPEER